MSPLWVHRSIHRSPILQTQVGSIRPCRPCAWFVFDQGCSRKWHLGWWGCTNSTSTNTDDFFSFNDDSIAEPTTSSTSMECLQYLEDKAHTLDSLHKYHTVKAMFIKYNAAIRYPHPHLLNVSFHMRGWYWRKNVAVWQTTILSNSCCWKQTDIWCLRCKPQHVRFCCKAIVHFVVQQHFYVHFLSDICLLILPNWM